MAVYAYGFSIGVVPLEGWTFVDLDPGVIAFTHVSVLRAIPLSVKLERVIRRKMVLVIG